MKTDKKCIVCGEEVEDGKNACNRCVEFTNRTNRGYGQTKMLLQLVDNDRGRLKDLETMIKNCHYFGCPGDREEVERVMGMVVRSKWFTF